MSGEYVLVITLFLLASACFVKWSVAAFDEAVEIVQNNLIW